MLAQLLSQAFRRHCLLCKMCTHLQHVSHIFPTQRTLELKLGITSCAALHAITLSSPTSLGCIQDVAMHIIGAADLQLHSSADAAGEIVANRIAAWPDRALPRLLSNHKLCAGALQARR